MFGKWLLYHLVRKSCIIYLLIGTLSLFAQEKVRFDNVNLPDNVNNKWMHDIFQDSKGYIWFANWDGLNRYDGYELKTFRLPSDIWSATGFHYVEEDKYGFIWCSPLRIGIFRFNPALEKFEFFNYDTTDHNKRIWDMYVDKDGFMWIASNVGLYSFRPPAPGEKLENVHVLKYVHNPQDSTSLSMNAINTIFQDRQKKYWIGTRTNGIDILYERAPDGKFIHYPFSPDHNSVAGNNIQEIFQDSNGNIWIGTQNSGISIIVKDSLSDNVKFINYTHDKNNPYSLLSNRIFKIVQTKDGTIWISAAYGLQKVKSKDIDFNNLKFNTYTSNQNTPVSLNVDKMCADREGRLWISKYGTGIAVYDPGKYKFHHYKIPDSRIGHNSINSFFEKPGSKGRKVWISTNAGLYLFNRDNNEFTYTGNHPDKNEIINKFYQSRYNKNVWVGCKRFDLLADTITLNAGFCGFKKFDPYTGKTTVLNKNAKTLLTYQNNNTSEHYPVTDINDIEEISEKYIVLATNFGIALYDQEENKYIQEPKGPLSKLANINGAILDLLYDSKENLWISVMSKTGNHDVFRFNPRSGEIRNYLNPESENTTNTVYKIIEDSKGDIWAGTASGLWKYQYDRDIMIFYHLPKGKYKIIWAKNMLKDDNNDLWLSGYYLTKFNIENQSYWIYKKEDGLQEDNFNQVAAYKSPVSGEMYLGGDNGFNIFHPDSIKVSTYTPPVFITDFELMNKPATLADFRETEHILPGESIKSIILNYDQNSFSFKFAALDYTNPSNNRYLYKLTGLDKEWIQSYDRKATYTNLDPGEYIFRVKGSNHDGVWNEKETILKITILPPWWETTYAYILYALIIISIIYLTWRMQLKRIKVKHEYEMSRFEAEKLYEVDELKSRFFINISHEFRTPLTLIQGPAEKINSQTSNDIIKDSGIIKRNSQQLLKLVNQLLDLSRLETGKMKLQASKNNIVSFVKGIALSFESLSEEKDITLKILSEKEYVEIYFDKEKMIEILSNILSNSFKFTPQDGKITIGIKENNKNVEIKIIDTGIGIPKEEIPKLFDRFYQVDSSFTKEHQGTGIGLALVKELVELHHGKISVQSEKGRWTEFILYFPLGRNHLKDDEIVITDKTGKTEDLISEQDYYFPGINKNNSDNEIESDSLKEEKIIILVVEDNYDMREYIKESLGEGYLVEEAVNGEQGVRKAENIIPDLIITDMMMPKMDGNELTRTLKNNEKTSHIPIIILTAKSGQESKLEGLETGADDYQTKPFDIKELQVRIKNLINIRRKLQEKFRGSEYINIKTKKNAQTDRTKNLKLKGIDEKFINKVLSVIEEHISEESFSIEKLGNEVGMSKAQFYRKIIALTGVSPSIYLRTIRLTKAKKMIEEKQGNIAEIAFSVGFSTPSYFAKCFKSEFGYVPSDL